MINHVLFLGLGSNLGNKSQNLEHAYEEIEKRIGRVISRSAFYITDPVGFDSENSFINAVCKVYTSLEPEVVLNEILNIEKTIGRETKSVNGIYSDRLIDIDILMYDDLELNTENLIIPHPRFHLRDFVLIPFTEISPNTIHPIFKKSIEQLSCDI